MLSEEEQEQLLNAWLHRMADNQRKNKKNAQAAKRQSLPSSHCSDDVLELAQLLKQLRYSHADIVRQIF
jgi:hypothetical protein